MLSAAIGFAVGLIVRSPIAAILTLLAWTVVLVTIAALGFQRIDVPAPE